MPTSTRKQIRNQKARKKKKKKKADISKQANIRQWKLTVKSCTKSLGLPTRFS